ncbi:hypothetical protein Tco_0109407 [Tanacetum coccineum]
MSFLWASIDNPHCTLGTSVEGVFGGYNVNDLIGLEAVVCSLRASAFILMRSLDQNICLGVNLSFNNGPVYMRWMYPSVQGIRTNVASRYSRVSNTSYMNGAAATKHKELLDALSSQESGENVPEKEVMKKVLDKSPVVGKEDEEYEESDDEEMEVLDEHEEINDGDDYVEIMETQAIDDQDHLVNYDNDNENDDLGYRSEEYFDEGDEEDENNHSNKNVVKRGITRLYKFRREYGKPDGIKLSKKVDSEARDKQWDEIMRYFDVDLTVRKMIEKKEIEPDEEPPHGTPWLKGRVNKEEEYPNDEIRSVGDKLKETEDKVKEGTLKVDHGTDAMTFILGKEKGGHARGVGSGVTYKRYFDLPRSRQASDERILLLQSQLANERCERQEKELLIQNLSNKMSQTEGMVTTLKNQKSNGLATLEKEMETRVSNKTSPCDF